ncbi:MAG: hypothetical protein WBM87_03575 [Woeseiaceae bacterium]
MNTEVDDNMWASFGQIRNRIVVLLLSWPFLVSLVLSFAFWKSPFSQALIDLINAVTAAKIGRVVDYSDILAFAVIPFAWIIELRQEDERVSIAKT